jgi:serine protease
MKSSNLLCCLLATVQLSACADVAEKSDEMSWEEFEAQTYREPGGMYIIDSDVTVLDEAALREVYERSRSRAGSVGVTRSALVVNQVGGVDDRWPDGQHLNITYCVSDAFGALNQARVAAAMEAAAASWEESGFVNFVHEPFHDASCDENQADVAFDVRPGETSWLARSFRPSYPRAERSLLLTQEALGQPSGRTLTDILRHELGHVLGFDHETTRADPDHTCFEDAEWRALTPYDSSSAMTSPTCIQSSNWDFELTATDREGLAVLYAPVLERRWTQTGTVAKNTWQDYPAFTVTPGTPFKVTMTGTGDADLYVRFGSKPELARYSCRSWGLTSTESCDLVVPNGYTTAYVSVRGFAPTSTFSLEAVYHAQAR